MQPLSGSGAPNASDRSQAPAKIPPGTDNQPLTPGQRTTLEKLIVKIMALMPVKSAEIWAALRHDLGVSNEGELDSRHFPAAEKLLQNRLTIAQDTHASRQLMQQLTELLPQGNNRQAVSDFIRQQFGHTVLSQLTHEQLQQVLVLIQSCELTIPQPQQTTVTTRPLLPAEQHSLQQQVTKLSAATGEMPAKIWHELFNLIGVKNNDPIPARHFQLVSQFLQVQITLSQQTAPTLHNLLGVLKQPATAHEQQSLADYAQSRFNASLTTVLTQPQLYEVIGFLFSHRVTDKENVIPTLSAQPSPQPLLHPLIAMLPVPLQSGGKPLLFIAAVVIVVLLWLLF
jgi:hypothetical protein